MPKSRQLVPAMGHQTGGLTGWAVRQAVEAQLESTVTDAQLKRFHGSGFLEDPAADGTWPAGTVERLIKTLELESSARPLHRRLLVFRQTYYVHSAKVRQTMLALVRAPTGIKRKPQKMQRLDSAVRWWVGVLGGFGSPLASETCPNCGYPLTVLIGPSGATRRRRSQPRHALPPAREWASILSSNAVTPEMFMDAVNSQYRVLSDLAADTSNPHNSSDIPAEEQAVILTVRYLATLVRVQQRSSATAET